MEYSIRALAACKIFDESQIAFITVSYVKYIMQVTQLSCCPLTYSLSRSLVSSSLIH